MCMAVAIASAVLLGASLSVSVVFAATPERSGTFHGLKFRDLGPAVAGGRVTSVLGVAGDPALYYVGTAGGGVWKTEDGGTSWKAIFTHEPTQSIGSLALAGDNPNWLWVGTGEGNPRNDVLNGDGVYFSPDGGATWADKGLNRAGQIAAIAVDPQNTDTVFVCAEGNLWKRGPERGVYMSTDDGTHWNRVLYLNDHTGCSTIAFKPGDPKVLIAGMWPLQQRAWMLTSGGKSGGLYRSTDGGVHWKKLTKGLPKGAIGRSAVAFARSEPQTVYALLQAKGGVLWVSHDGGANWRKVSNDHSLDVRPFYFTQLGVMPNRPDRLFFLSMHMMESKDGGKHVFYADKGVHVDHHAIWIDPKNPNRIIQGNDGGVYLSFDAGKHWRHLGNLPIEQLYQVDAVATNDPWPYLVCAGIQDNGVWCGASSDYNRGGVRSSLDWFAVMDGDGEYAVPRDHGTLIYATSNDGIAARFNRKTGIRREIDPYLPGMGAGLRFLGQPTYALRYRFNWTAPMAVASRNVNDIYLGADVVFKSIDGGRHWTAISSDLTRNDKSKQRPSGGPINHDLSGAPVYDTIQSMALSRIDANVIWVGTDDGWVWVSRDDGAHWSNVTPPGVPQWARVYHVESSPFAAGTAYAAFDGHEIGNNAPYVYRTTDYGRRWTRISRGLPDSSVEVVAEDPHRGGLLFAGTISAGLYVSFDDGGHWQPLHANLPRGLSVWDLTFAPDHRGLLLATHGRGVWALDNLRPIEQYSATVARAPFYTFTASPGVLLNRRHSLYGNGVDPILYANGADPSAYVTPDAPTGAVISYYLDMALKPTATQMTVHQGPVRIAIRDAAGNLVATLYGSTRAGINEVIWNLRYGGPAKLDPPYGNPDGRREVGPAVLPGTYAATLHAGSLVQEVKLRVEPDPRYRFSRTAASADLRAALAARAELSAVNRLLNHVTATRMALDAVLARGESDAIWARRHSGLLADGKALDKTLKSFQNVFWNPRVQPNVGEDVLRHMSRLHLHVLEVYWMTLRSWGEKPRSQLLAMISADHSQIERLLARYNGRVLSQVKLWNSAASAAGVATLPIGAVAGLRTPSPAPTKPGSQTRSSSSLKAGPPTERS